MNVAPSPESLRPAPLPAPVPARRRSWPGWLADILLGKVDHAGAHRHRPRRRALDLPHPGARHLAVRRGARHRRRPGARQSLRPAVARRRRSPAGSPASGSSAAAAPPARACMCGWSCCSAGVAVAPTILVACFAVAFFHFGIQAWFNDPVREALERIAAGLARLSGRAPQQYPRRRAGDGQRPEPRRHVACRPSRRCSARCWRRRPRCAA